MTEASRWRRCSACKKPLEFGASYWVCNVSTCNRKRTALCFCSVSCWEVHLPVARHREAWAEERTAPAADVMQRDDAATAKNSMGRRRLVRPETQRRSEPPAEVLIVASRLKDYIRAQSGFNTSDSVLQPLSEIVRRVCEQAIRNARGEGRRTVLDRDVPAD